MKSVCCTWVHLHNKSVSSQKSSELSVRLLHKIMLEPGCRNLLQFSHKSISKVQLGSCGQHVGLALCTPLNVFHRKLRQLLDFHFYLRGTGRGGVLQTAASILKTSQYWIHHCRQWVLSVTTNGSEPNHKNKQTCVHILLATESTTATQIYIYNFLKWSSNNRSNIYKGHQRCSLQVSYKELQGNLD